MASIHKKGSGWIVRWREGSRQRSRYAPSNSVARELAREIERAEALGQRWQPEAAREVPAVAVVAEKFIEASALRRAASTTLLLSGHLDLFVGWLEGTRPGATVDVLSVALLEDYFRELTQRATGRHGRPRGVATARKYVATVELMWDWAGNRDEYDGLVPRPRRVTRELTRPTPRAVVAPTWAQSAACIRELSGWQKQLGVVLYYTGLRVQQGMALRWDDVDLEAAMLTIRPELGKTHREREGRVVPVSAHLVAELRRWTGDLRDPEWLVPCARVPGDRERTARPRDFLRAWKRAGVPPIVWSGRSHHAFRKGVQTGLVEARASWEAVEALLGHTLPGVGDQYVQRSRLPMREAVDLIPALPAEVLPSSEVRDA